MIPIVMALLTVAALSACRIERGPSTTAVASTSTAPGGRVVLYTSAYREVTDALVALARTELPDVQLEVFQGGSEKVASRLDADLAAGRAGADVLLVSDPFLSRRLKRDGELLAYASPRATPIDRRLVDLDNAFVAARVSTMAVVWNTTTTTKEDAPTSLTSLLRGEDDRSADLAFADPLSSGTAFMTAVVVGDGDVTYLKRLRARGASIAGGNAVVVQKVLSGERRFGVVLLENALTAEARGEPLGWLVPDDTVVIPGDVSILNDTANPGAARAVVDLILSPAGQAIIRGDDGRMHAVDPRVPPPKMQRDVVTLAALLDRRRVDPALLDRVVERRAAIQAALEAALLSSP
ncbi:MAG TPA: extracellular solute-binding protein [Myxococcota bacterium]